MLSSLEGKPLIGKPEYWGCVARKNQSLQDAKQLTDWSRQIAENEAAIVKLENQIEALTPWLKLDVPLSGSTTKQSVCIVGMMPGAWTADAIYGMVAETEDAPEAYEVQILSADKDTTYLAVTALKEEAGKLEDILRQHGFSRPSQASKKIPQEEKKDCEIQIEDLKQMIHEAVKKIEGNAGRRRICRKYPTITGSVQTNTKCWVSCPSQNIHFLLPAMSRKKRCSCYRKKSAISTIAGSI